MNRIRNPINYARRNNKWEVSVRNDTAYGQPWHAIDLDTEFDVATARQRRLRTVLAGKVLRKTAKIIGNAKYDFNVREKKGALTAGGTAVTLASAALAVASVFGALHNDQAGKSDNSTAERMHNLHNLSGAADNYGKAIEDVNLSARDWGHAAWWGAVATEGTVMNGYVLISGRRLRRRHLRKMNLDPGYVATMSGLYELQPIFGRINDLRILEFSQNTRGSQCKPPYEYEYDLLDSPNPYRNRSQSSGKPAVPIQPSSNSFIDFTIENRLMIKSALPMTDPMERGTIL